MSSEYAGTPESFAWFRGRTIPGAAIRVWTSRDRTTAVTQLVRPDDGYLWPGGIVQADARGWYRFATVHSHESLFVEAVGGDGTLYRIDRADVGARVATLEQGMGAIGADAASARADAETALTAATAARDVLEGELGRVNQPEGLVRLNDAGKVGYGQLPADSAASSFLTWGDYWTVDAEHSPQVAGFRGMGNVLPGNTLEGVRGYLDLHPFVAGVQVPVVWLDVFSTDETALVVIRHDSFTTTTTTRPYTLQDMTIGQVRQARVDGERFHPRWPDLPVPTLEDVFAEFAGRCLFVLNFRTIGTIPHHLITTITTYGMQDSVIVGAFPGAIFTDYQAYGIRTMAVVPVGSTVTTAQLDTFQDLGLDWVALDASGLTPANGASQVAAARARGIKVLVYPLERHYELDRVGTWGVAGWPWGCDMYASPDPLYCSYGRRAKSRIFFGNDYSGTWQHGQLSNGLNGERFPNLSVDSVPEIGAFGGQHLLNNPLGVADNSLNIDGERWAVFESPGWAVPVYAGAVQTIESRVRVLRSLGGSWITIGFGFDSDRPFQYQGTGSTVLTGDPSLNGWIVVIRDDGNIYLRRVDGGVMEGADRASLTTGGGGITVPDNMGFRIKLSATQVQVSVLTGAGAVVKTLTHADNSPLHRGRYFAWGTRRSEAVFYRPGAGGGSS